jgi:hypothetical protein
VAWLEAAKGLSKVLVELAIHGLDPGWTLVLRRTRPGDLLGAAAHAFLRVIGRMKSPSIQVSNQRASRSNGGQAFEIPKLDLAGGCFLRSF